jgi:hypothetical protein
MMARKDTVHRRFLNAIKFKDPYRRLRPLRDKFGDDEFVRLLARMPLRDEIMTAFESAGMDRTDPRHWLQLMAIFAWAHFGAQQGPGAPIRWHAEKLCQLADDFNEIKKRNLNLLTESILKLLAKKGQYGTKKGPLSASRLRKLLKEAYDPERNELLNVLQLGDPVNRSGEIVSVSTTDKENQK